MRRVFYLSAAGTEAAIRAFHEHLKLPGSNIKALLSQPELWIWRTEYENCVGDFPEDELEAYLDSHPSLRHELKLYRDHLDSLSGVIVSYYEEGDDPRGFSISSNLIKLLAEMDASLEIDVVPDIMALRSHTSST
jgi:hypothetical protein